MQLLCVQLHSTLYTAQLFIVSYDLPFRVIGWYIMLANYNWDVTLVQPLPWKIGEIYKKTSNTWHWMMKDPGHFLWPNSDGHGLWTMESGLCCVMKQCAAVTTQLSAINVPAHPPWYRQGGIFVAGSLSQKRKKERKKQTNKQTNKVEMFSASVSPL